MKKIYALMAAMAVMATAAACEKKEYNNNGGTESTPAATTAENGDITATESENTVEAETVTESVTEAPTEAKTEELTMPEDVSAFEAALDEDVIAAAQQLFEKACETEWNFTVGSPYPLDTSEYFSNKYGWQFYLVTAEGINSLADVRADYHNVFSKDYEDTLDELYMEQGGRVYCLNGARGSDIFYEGSEVVEITGRDEGEIRFKVVDSYNGASFGGEAYTEEREFVIVKESDGKWKVSEFKLPY